MLMPNLARLKGIYGQVVNNPTPRFNSIDTGNLVLHRNQIQLCPAGPPKDIPMQPPPLPLAQPSAQPSAPAVAVYTPDRQLAAMPLQADRPDSLPPAEPQQGNQEIVELYLALSRQPNQDD